jgi:hypothetical protein
MQKCARETLWIEFLASARIFTSCAFLRLVQGPGSFERSRSLCLCLRKRIGLMIFIGKRFWVKNALLAYLLVEDRLSFLHDGSSLSLSLSLSRASFTVEGPFRPRYQQDCSCHIHANVNFKITFCHIRANVNFKITSHHANKH